MSRERRLLKSWKEIASYLGVGVRTAQRWKERRGLPVKQPGASRKSAVLALTEEIDRWLRQSTNSRDRSGNEREELAAIVATDQLWHRGSRPRELERQVEALIDLGRLMAYADRRTILSEIAGYALALCKAESSGFSILEIDESGSEIFRWTATRGRMNPFEGGTTPAEFSPCGYCLERNSPQLFIHPERYYDYLQPISPLSEVLLIPMHNDSHWVGTIWIISHERRRKFDREDARLMTALASLASATFLKRKRSGARELSAES